MKAFTQAARGEGGCLPSAACRRIAASIMSGRPGAFDLGRSGGRASSAKGSGPGATSATSGAANQSCATIGSKPEGSASRGTRRERGTETDMTTGQLISGQEIFESTSTLSIFSWTVYSHRRMQTLLYGASAKLKDLSLSPEETQI